MAAKARREHLSHLTLRFLDRENKLTFAAILSSNIKRTLYSHTYISFYEEYMRGEGMPLLHLPLPFPEVSPQKPPRRHSSHSNHILGEMISLFQPPTLWPSPCSPSLKTQRRPNSRSDFPEALFLIYWAELQRDSCYSTARPLPLLKSLL